MSLIVETGAGSATSESYASVADADERMAARGNDTWTPLTTAEKEEALRRATDYMTAAFRERWQGYRQHITQALDWPRIGVKVDAYHYINPDTVPVEIVNACIDLAFRAAAGDLAPDLTRGVLREKVGPIETDYDRGSPQYTRFRAIEMMLSPYLTGGSGMARLVRS